MPGSRPGSAASDHGNVLLLHTGSLEVVDLDIESYEEVLLPNTPSARPSSRETHNVHKTGGTSGEQGEGDETDKLASGGRIGAGVGESDGVSGEDRDNASVPVESSDGAVEDVAFDLKEFNPGADDPDVRLLDQSLTDPRPASRGRGEGATVSSIGRFVYSAEFQGFVIVFICLDVLLMVVSDVDVELVSDDLKQKITYAVLAVMGFDTCLRVYVDGIREFFNVRKDPFKTLDVVVLALCLLFEFLAVIPTLSAASRMVRLARFVRLFGRLARFLTVLRRMKSWTKKDDGSGLTTRAALMWTVDWSFTHASQKMTLCMLWLLALCVHPVLQPLIVRYLFDRALGLRDVFHGGTVEVDLKLTGYATLALLGSSLFYAQMKYRLKVDSPSGGVCIAQLQSQIADKFSRMPVEWIDAISKSYITEMILSDTKILDLNIDAFTEMMRVSLFYVVYLLVLVFLSWRLALILVVLMPISYIFNSEKVTKLQKLQNIRDHKVALFEKTASQQIALTLSRVRMGLKHDTAARLRAEAGELLDEYATVEEVEAELERGISLYYMVQRTLILTMGSQFLARRLISLGSFVAFMLASQVSEGVVGQFTWATVQLNSSRRPLRRFLDLINREETVKMKSKETRDDTLVSESTSDLRRQHKSAYIVRAQGCEFAFKERPFGVPVTVTGKLLHDINVNISQGSMTVITGTSGSGKTVLLKMLSGMYRATHGTVHLAGRDINSIGTAHRVIAYLPNDIITVEGSIARNMRLAHESAPDAALAVIAMQLALDPEHFANGLNTDVRLLDGPQRQRLGIARALLLNRPLLFMDQPLSNQAPEMAKKIISILRFLRVPSPGGGAQLKATTVWSSNNVSTLRHADQVLFVNDGCVVESGLFDDLMAKRGHVYKQVRMSEGLEPDANGGHSMKPEHLRRLWIFHYLDAENAEEVSKLFTAHHYAAKEMLFRATQFVNALYIHISGLVDEYPASTKEVAGMALGPGHGARQPDDTGVVEPKQTWRPGRLIGARHLLQRTPHWESTAVARGEVKVMKLDRGAFLDLCERNTAVHESVRRMHAAVHSILSPSRLALIWFFADVPTRSLAALARRFRLTRLETGVTLFADGDERSRGMTIVVDGAVAVRRASPDIKSGTRKQWIQFLRAGAHVASELLGMAAQPEGSKELGVDVLHGARAVRPTVVAQLGTSEFTNWLGMDPSASAAVRKTLAARERALAPDALRRCWCLCRLGARGLAMMAACFTPLSIPEGTRLLPSLADRAFIVISGELIAERELVHRDGSVTVVRETWSARTKPGTVLNDAALSRFAWDHGHGAGARDAETVTQITARSPAVLLTLAASAYRAVVRRESDRLWAARPTPPPALVPNLWSPPREMADAKALTEEQKTLRMGGTLYDLVAGDVQDRAGYTVGPPPWDPPEPEEFRPSLSQELALRARMQTVAMYKGDVLDGPACFVAVVLHGELWAHVGGPPGDEASYEVVKRFASPTVGVSAALRPQPPPVIMSPAARRALAPQGRIPGKVVVSGRVISPVALVVLYDVEPLVDNRPGVIDAFFKEQDALEAATGAINKRQRQIRRATATNITLSVLLGIRPKLDARRLWRAAYKEAKMYRIRTQNSVFVEEAQFSLLNDALHFDATLRSLAAEERAMRALELARRARLEALVAEAKALDQVPAQPGESVEDTTAEAGIGIAVAKALTTDDESYLGADRLETLRRAIELCRAERASRLAKQLGAIEEVMAELRLSAITKAEEHDEEMRRIGGDRGDSAGSVGREGAPLSTFYHRKTGTLVETETAGGGLNELGPGGRGGAVGKTHGQRLEMLRVAAAELSVVRASEPTSVAFRLARGCLERLSAAYEPPLADLREELRELWRDLRVPKDQVDRCALESRQFESASLALVREHTVAVANLRAARRQMLAFGEGSDRLEDDDVRFALRLGAKSGKLESGNDAALAHSALADRDRHFVRVIHTECEKGAGVDEIMERLSDHDLVGLGEKAVRRMADLAMNAQTEMNTIIIHRAALMKSLRESWATLETRMADREVTAALISDARGAALTAAEDMVTRLAREAARSRRARDVMLARLAEKWRLLGTDETRKRRTAQRTLVGSAEEIVANSLNELKILAREERSRRDAADIVLGGANAVSTLTFYEDVRQHVEAFGGDVRAMWSILIQFHNNRRAAVLGATCEAGAPAAGPASPAVALLDLDGADAAAKIVPLRAIATLVSSKVHAPDSISAFGAACYVADGGVTYEGFRLGMRRCEGVKAGWKELDAEEAAMSPSDRDDVRVTLNRALNRLDRARAVLDGVTSLDIASQRLAMHPTELMTRVLECVACVLREDEDAARLVEDVDMQLRLTGEDDGTAGDTTGAETEEEAAALDDKDKMEIRELNGRWASALRVLDNPEVITQLRSISPSSLPVDVLRELRERLREDDTIMEAAEAFANDGKNLDDYEAITSATGGDTSEKLIGPLAFYVVCIESAASLHKLWTRRQLQVDADRIARERVENPEVNPLGLAGKRARMRTRITRGMTLALATKVNDKKKTKEIETETSAVKRMFGSIFGTKKVAPGRSDSDSD